MRSRRLYALLVLAFVGLFSALPVSADVGARALLWSVSKAGEPTSYLFGTIHAEDPRVLEVPKRVLRAMRQCQVFATEIELTEKVRRQFAAGMTLPPGQQLSKLLGKDLYNYTVGVMQHRGFAPEQVDRMKPWAVMLTLSVPPPRTGLFLDLVLYHEAQTEHKAVLSLETVGEVVNVFDGINMTQQRQLLYETLLQYRNFSHMFNAVVEAYLMRDLDGLQALQDQSLDFHNASLKALYTKRLITDRNHHMLQRLLPELPKTSVFVAVGALHLPGDEGLIALLRQAGYQVSPVF